jgi:DNA-directed RNA polymerase subunit RPC12/RpoP
MAVFGTSKPKGADAMSGSSQKDGLCPRCHGQLLSVLWDGKLGGGEYLECESCGWRQVVSGVEPGKRSPKKNRQGG